MSEDVKRLYRSRSDRWLFGVCGGIADYFSVDPTLVRVLFVIFTLIFGSGILLYLILWLIIPQEPEESK
jgi:phage shock protein C